MNSNKKSRISSIKDISQQAIQNLLENILENIKKVKIPDFDNSLVVDIFKNDKENLVITSHQPVIYTCGVLSKFLYNTLTKTIIYNDSDKAEFKFLSKKLYFDKPIEKLSKEDVQEFINFVNSSWQYYSKFLEHNKSIKENVRLFLYVLNSSGIDNFPYFWHQVVIKYLENFDLKTNFNIENLSKISSDANLKVTIKDYFLWIIDNYDSFYNLYNEAVDIFRNKIGFYPIKKLEKGETGFWLLNENKRENLFYKNGSFVNENGQKVNVLQIRPKAVTWAIYRRYFLYRNPLDILGVGSSYYNFISDYIAINLLSSLPPSTTCVSLSLSINLPYYQQIVNLKSIINSFKTTILKNPEKLTKIYQHLKNYDSYLDLTDLSSIVNKINILLDKNLLKQKELLLDQINKKENRKIKKELTAKINEINQELTFPLIPLLEELKKIAEILELQIEKLFEEYKEIKSRDYPFFFINPIDILEKINTHLNKTSF